MLLPNQLTLLRIILTPIFLIFFLLDDPLFKQISIIIFFLAALTDWYDGWLARKFNYITSWGKFLDPLADKILTSAAFLGFVFSGILPLWMVLLIIIRDLLVTILRVLADYKNFSFNTSYYAKWKTFLQMAFLYYLLIFQVGLTTIPYFSGNKALYDFLMNRYFIYIVMLIITIITVHSGFTYLYRNRYLLIKIFKSEN
jgi:CDP-diacylglycerol---glycerol-3-phosphate 3-phosphatidyltransferase